MQQTNMVGDIVRTQWPEQMAEHINLYLGSGRFGACFDAYGLMNNGARGAPLTSISRTVLMHADHWHRGAWGLDYWLPLARLVWSGVPSPPPAEYRQELRILQGCLLTEMRRPGLATRTIAHFHPETRDLLAVNISYKATMGNAMPPLLLAAETDIRSHYDQHLAGTARTVEKNERDWWMGRIRAGTADSVLGLRVISNEGVVALKAEECGVQVSFKGARGDHLLLIGAAGYRRRAGLRDQMRAVTDGLSFRKSAVAAWRRRWGGARIEVPVREYQALWERSHFYVLSSCAPDIRSPPAPMGWSANGWPFHFPQDVSCIHPALLRLGHLDIARSWVEFYREQIETMQEYTDRIYKARGTMWAWEFPIGPRSELLRNGAPNWFQFEIHNAAYPARMAREASLHLGNRQWSCDIAWPVVRESARFLSSVARRNKNGLWGIRVKPSMGQDEMGGQDASNYLCALFSTLYTLQTAVAMAEELGLDDTDMRLWRTILRDGLAFTRLYERRLGIYATCEGLTGATQVGKQKHPVQLNPLTFLPLRLDTTDRATLNKPDKPTKKAYAIRNELCAGVKKSFYHGWTLAAHWLAAAHMRDARGLARELAQSLPARYVDPDWIQIYETSGSIHAPFYVTSHGLFLQALNDAIVSDYWGYTEIGAACPPEWEGARFTSLRTADGNTLSGELKNGRWKVTT